ncbi:MULTISPECIES: hypothetical protein [unclassified Pseudomonas]|uniref:hypothetical protein n=1 Tax=unclassified Pseudomonas TaxID=196821 RepID=UPI0011EF8354|nr:MULTISPECIES: hypothetical protein [unclassified Pseudomonas]KAA0945700.1 hypothetical protein FQ182_15575 [Pseudomonas sp. ANT_H4]KAA0951549.1 hypothetical protein FQ186_15310 [Pseudomonas sp. ANT_H14]
MFKKSKPDVNRAVPTRIARLCIHHLMPVTPTSGNDYRPNEGYFVSLIALTSGFVNNSGRSQRAYLQGRRRYLFSTEMPMSVLIRDTVLPHPLQTEVQP